MKTETQIQEWANAPTRDNDKSASTYATIKKVLESRFGNNVDIFLRFRALSVLRRCLHYHAILVQRIINSGNLTLPKKII